MSTLTVQLILFINARHYRTFNLQQHSSFKIVHLKRSLADDFGASFHQLQFTRVSGLFIRDQDALFNLRASDGNHASLDITLNGQNSISELDGKVISFKFCTTPHPTDLAGFSNDGIQKVNFEHSTAQLENYGAPASHSSPDPPMLTLYLKKAQEIALRAQLEDPFNILSRSCFEEEFEGEDSATEVWDEELDDDLYSDDGEMPVEELDQPECYAGKEDVPPEATEEQKKSCNDSSQLRYENLVSLASASSFYHPKREIPMRLCLLKTNFQRKLRKEIASIRLKTIPPSRSQEIELPASVTTPITPPTLSSRNVCLHSSAKPRPSLRKLVIPDLSSALSVGVINHQETPASPVAFVAGGNGYTRASTALRLTNLLLNLQRARAFSGPDKRHEKVYYVQ